MFNTQSRPIIIRRTGVNLYEAIRRAGLVTVRKKLNANEKNICSTFKRHIQKFDDVDLVFPKNKLETLRYGDIKVLDGNDWLNDEVIYAYLRLLQAEFPDVHMHNSFFMDILLGNKKRKAYSDGKIICIDTDAKDANEIPVKNMKRSQNRNIQVHDVVHDSKNYNYDNVRKWTTNVKIYQKRLLFCPINLHNTHWVATAAVMNNNEKEKVRTLLANINSNINININTTPTGGIGFRG